MRIDGHGEGNARWVHRQRTAAGEGNGYGSGSYHEMTFGDGHGQTSSGTGYSDGSWAAWVWRLEAIVVAPHWNEKLV